MLDSTVESVNSALKRARASLERRLPPTGEREPAPDPDAASERALVAEFVRAYESADLTMLPKTTVAVEDESAAKKLLRLMDALEENDDVQDVYANFDIPEQVLESVAT